MKNNKNVKRIIFASSIYARSRMGGFYSSTKRSCESLIEEYKNIFNLNYTILRFGSLYGLRANHFNAINNFVIQAIKYNKIERNKTLFIIPAVSLDSISCPKGFNTLFNKGLKNSGAPSSLLLPGVQVPLIFASKLVNEHCLSLSFQSSITIGINTIIYFNHSPDVKNTLVTISSIKNTCIK